MDAFEKNLSRALQEPAPRGDLENRILNQASTERRRPILMSRRAAGVAAAIVLVATGMGLGIRYEIERARRLESERAKAQVLEAFRLAGEQLRPFRERLQQVPAMTIAPPEGEK